MRLVLRLVVGHFALLAAACGEGGNSDSSASALTASLASQYAETERCAGLEAPAPAIRYEPTHACPNGQMCCMESFGEPACETGACGLGGFYDQHTATIYLPDRCTDLFRHEAIHHLLFVNGRADWGDHAAPEFRCE